MTNESKTPKGGDNTPESSALHPATPTFETPVAPPATPEVGPLTSNPGNVQAPPRSALVTKGGDNPPEEGAFSLREGTLPVVPPPTQIGVGAGARVTRAQQVVMDMGSNPQKNVLLIQAAIDDAVAAALSKAAPVATQSDNPTPAHFETERALAGRFGGSFENEPFRGDGGGREPLRDPLPGEREDPGPGEPSVATKADDSRPAEPGQVHARLLNVGGGETEVLVDRCDDGDLPEIVEIEGDDSGKTFSLVSGDTTPPVYTEVVDGDAPKQQSTKKTASKKPKK